MNSKEQPEGKMEKLWFNMNWKNVKVRTSNLAIYCKTKCDGIYYL